ncbi:uncharacterized protein LOC126842664 [Adelges cooleyi]|uniref:uncharacterized protein LOC126842664 n=1 Tax=Adelges cooleyi TaxID=133065 RepID=UPI00217FC4DE|nr:uncharacterized protein LOC126842664 [Adelges cooleyi]XP_050435685.1 uncharacterized protein LOC126842664 [Adelges cooleyi]XP_050435686.1 uncharacterized protein LOC126842664 [Adelges cooleyi]
MDPFRRPSMIPTNKDELMDSAPTSRMFEEFLNSFEQYDKEELHKRRNSESLSDCVKVPRRRVFVKQSFFPVDASFVKANPNHVYITDMDGHLYIVKYKAVKC